MRAFVIRRESKEASMKKYGPREQWRDVEQNAPWLGLEVSEDFGVIIRESATRYTEEGKKREKFQNAVNQALELMRQGECGAALFPRVDRETRNIFISFPILSDAINRGLRVFFARERFELDPSNSESVDKYFQKAREGTAYVDTLRENSMGAKFARAFDDHKLPNGRVPWPFDYDKETGRAVINRERADWVRRWLDWLLIDGIGTLEICRRMNEMFPSPRGGQWRPKSVTDILRNRALIGEFYAKDRDGEQKLVYRNEGQTTYTVEEFEAVGKRLDEIRENSYYNATKAEHHYPPITKFVYCSEHKRMYAFPNRHRPYYRCKECGKIMNATKLWDQFFPEIKEAFLREERLIPRIKAQFGDEELIARYEAEIEEKSEAIRSFEQAKDKAVRMGMYLQNYPLERVQEQIDKADLGIQRLEAEQDGLRQKLNNLKQQIIDEEGVKRFCQMISRNIDSLTKEQWEIIGKLTSLKITVYDKELVKVNIALPPVREEAEFNSSLSTSRKLT